MKKVFLLLASALMGVATYAGNTWEFDDANNEIEVDWSAYGEQDANGTSIQWQAGCLDALADVVNEVTGNVAWVPEVGQGFHVKITGIPNMTGKFQFCLVDERQLSL